MDTVFCVSAPRSGSTLLTRILNCHSEIAAPFEIPVARYRFGADNENLAIDKTLQIAQLVGADLCRAIEDSSYLFDKIRFFEKKRLLIVKEPANSLHLGRIRADFGEVPMVHIVRDVRQVMSSDVFQRENLTLKQVAMMWQNFNWNILRYRHYFPKFHILRYEDLTTNPEKQISKLLDFLGLTFEAGMIEYWNFSHSDEKLALWEGQRPDESPWAQGLKATNIKRKFRKPSADVHQLYNALAPVKQMNELLGYR